MSVAAVVLAAGRGARMGGRCKAQLALPGGQSFLGAVVASARAAGVTPVVVVEATPFLEQVRALADRVADAVVENPAPERGMASSFACGLDWLVRRAGEVEAALIWPVDHPLVRAGTVAAIARAAARERIVVPVHGGRGGHPAAFGAACWPACAAAAAAPGGLRTLLGGASVIRVPVEDAGVVEDIDTLEALARLGAGEVSA